MRGSPTRMTKTSSKVLAMPGYRMAMSLLGSPHTEAEAIEVAHAPTLTTMVIVNLIRRRRLRFGG